MITDNKSTMKPQPYFKINTMSPQLLVADIERAIQFYTNELGFEIDFRYVGYQLSAVSYQAETYHNFGLLIADS